MTRPKWRNGIVTGTEVNNEYREQLRTRAWLSQYFTWILAINGSMLSSPLMCILTMWRLRRRVPFASYAAASAFAGLVKTALRRSGKRIRTFFARSRGLIADVVRDFYLPKGK